MPELPEVETTLRGLAPCLEGQPLTNVTIHTAKLRAPTPPAGPLIGLTVTHLERRAKYILLHLSNATTVLIHLGMSGRLTATLPQPPLRLAGKASASPERPASLGETVPQGGPFPYPPARKKHDHILLTTPKATVILNDARRFGLFLHLPTASLATHPLLRHLGPEPLADLPRPCLRLAGKASTSPEQPASLGETVLQDGPAFTPAYLKKALTSRKTAIKPTLMDNRIVVGVGNIYASESLFRARINPQTPAHQLTLAQLKTLIPHIQATLKEAIAAGGSTLRDYAHSNGQLGYFQHHFQVYGRAGQPCPACTTLIRKITQSQRATFYCPHCQK